MVIAGKIRGNAPQLASYLLAQGENEKITILDVDGHSDADASYLKDILYSMELNSELTRSKNSVYHAFINPNPEDTTDRAMTMEEWQKSVEILTKQLGYEDQRKVIVLHEKPGARVHAHIVYERYNHEHGVMATYEHNYNAHDKARAEMETKLSHKPTPQKNKNRDHHKQTLTQIWQRTDTADGFIREAEANGYKIAKGTDRPLKVVDADGVSFDLVRKLDGIKTKEVRARLADTELIPEKEAIRDKQAEKQKPEQTPVEPVLPVEETEPAPIIEAKPETPTIDDREEMRRKFLTEIKETRERNRNPLREITLYLLIALKVSFSFKGNMPKEAKPERRAVLAEQFTNNAFDMTAPEQPPPIPQPQNIITYRKALQIYKPI